LAQLPRLHRSPRSRRRRTSHHRFERILTFSIDGGEGEHSLYAASWDYETEDYGPAKRLSVGLGDTPDIVGSVATGMRMYFGAQAGQLGQVFVSDCIVAD
jgi:hypothetical protein